MFAPTTTNQSAEGGPKDVRLEISGLGFGYKNSDGPATSVFRDFDLQIESRTVHALVGPSGCGKSTLLRVVAGLEKPSAGSVRFQGTRVAPRPVSMVFQDPTLVPWWTVGRNVGVGVEFDERRSGLYSKIKAFSLDRVGLKGLAHRMPETLSTGQQTRASIARAMAYDADVMLLDEPFVHLDALTKRRLWEEFETHWQLDARTYVLVTHDIEEAVLLADRVTVLAAGSPARIVDTVEVGLNRPRGLASMVEPAFRSAVSRVWEALEASSDA